MSMRVIARIPDGPHEASGGRVVCCDSDHDSLPELVFSTGTVYPYDPLRIEVWEHQGWNRFRLVFADTGTLEYPWPHRINIGNAVPFAAGDIDGDGLTDVVCITCHYDTTGGGDTLFNDVITVESPDSFTYPCSLSWHYPYEHNQAPEATPTYYPPDLDGDGHDEILVAGTWIWENIGNDSNKLVWCTHECGFGAFGDFDMDGRMELAGGAPPQVWECVGDDQYERVYEDTAYFPAGIIDVFMTSDIDRNGRPEFYVTYFSYPQSRIWLCMYQDESDSHEFTRTLIDSVTFWPSAGHGCVSAGGDIDGDGIDECIWTTYDSVRVYKASGDGDLRKVWEWQNDHGIDALMTTVYDVNNDGYDELIAYSNRTTSVFEVDAVDLLSPNGGSCSVGDTVAIRWAVNTPPRCDSLSLFLRRDSLWHLSTIATGLPGTDTNYRWVVPSGVPETARVVVVAYGPGWQFDISDSVIYFIGGAVSETRGVYINRLLGCAPNPLGRATTISYELACAGSVALTVHDVSGRLVRRLETGVRTAGTHAVTWNGTDDFGRTVPTGVYFVRFSANGETASCRVTLVR